MAIVVTMCKLFAAMILGYLLNKMDILDERTGKHLSAMIITVVQPLLILSSVAGIEGDPGEVLMLFLAGVCCYAVFPMIAWVLVHIFHVPINLRGTYMCMIIFSNNAFMGYPVVSALFGNSAIFYATIFHMPFNLLLFSLGMYLIGKDARTDNVKAHKACENKGIKGKLHALRQVLNNGVLASAAAVIIYFCGLTLPEAVAESCSFIGNICMPLSMMVIGSNIANYPIKDLFTEKRVYLFTVVRLMLMPVLVFFVMQLFTGNASHIKIATVTIGMPIASAVAMISAPYKEQGKGAAIAVVFSTLCSLITIPVMCMLLGA